MFYSDIGHRLKMKVTHCLGVELFVRRDSQSFITNLCPHPSSLYRSAKIPSSSPSFSTRFYVQRIKTHDFFLYIYWLIFIGKPSVLRLLFLCFMKIHLGISSVYFGSLYLFFWRSNALSHVFRLMARRDELHMCR